MDLQDLFLTAVRASVLYFVLLLVIRLLGKRSVGAVSAFDLIVALMLSEVVDEVIFGDVTMIKGLLAIGIIAFWHFADEWISSKNQKVDELTGGKPRVLMEHGRFDERALAHERLNRAEVESQMRLQGIDDPSDVKRATLEPSGHISFLKTDEAETLRKRDLRQLEKAIEA